MVNLTKPTSGTHGSAALEGVVIPTTLAYVSDVYLRNELPTVSPITVGQVKKFGLYLVGSALGSYCYHNIGSTNPLQGYLGVAAGAVAVMSVTSAITSPTIIQPPQIRRQTEKTKACIDLLLTPWIEDPSKLRKGPGVLYNIDELFTNISLDLMQPKSHEIAQPFCSGLSRNPKTPPFDSGPFDNLDQAYVSERDKVILQTRKAITVLRAIRENDTNLPISFGIENLEVLPLWRAWWENLRPLQQNMAELQGEYVEFTNITDQIISKLDEQAEQMLKTTENARKKLREHDQQFQKLIHEILKNAEWPTEKAHALCKRFNTENSLSTDFSKIVDADIYQHHKMRKGVFG